jgi:hypothetical protein
MKRTRSSLQRVSSAPPVLERLLRQKLTEIELLPGMRAARLGSETARLKPSGSQPVATDNGRTPESWRLEWEECATNAERLDVLRRIDKQLSQQRGGSQLSARRGTREWKLAIARDTRASALVAIDHGISPSRVRQLRGELISGKLC